MSDWAEVQAPAPSKTSRYADTLASAVLGFDKPGFIKEHVEFLGLVWFGLWEIVVGVPTRARDIPRVRYSQYDLSHLAVFYLVSLGNLVEEPWAPILTLG